MTNASHNFKPGIDNALGTDPRPIVECLVDLGLSNDEIARYLRVPVGMVEPLAEALRADLQPRTQPRVTPAAEQRRRAAVQKQSHKFQPWRIPALALRQRAL